MKTDIHPKLHPVIFVDTSSGAEFVTTSTLTSEKMLLDTAGRVDKFRARQETAEKMKADHDKRKQKKIASQKETLEEKISRKAKENTEAKAIEKAEKIAKKKEAAKRAAKKVTKKK